MGFTPGARAPSRSAASIGSAVESIAASASAEAASAARALLHEHLLAGGVVDRGLPEEERDLVGDLVEPLHPLGDERRETANHSGRTKRRRRRR